MKNLTNFLASSIASIGLAVSVASVNAEALSGKVMDALTSATMKNFAVHLDTTRTYTNQNGDYTFDVPVGVHHLKVSDNITKYFNYEQDMNITTDTQKNVWMIPVRPVDTQYFSDFLKKLEYITRSDGSQGRSGGNTKIYRWYNNLLPIKIWYNKQQAIDIHGQEISGNYFNSLDMAIKEWEEKSRVDLFQIVNENPDIGIELDYTDSNSRVDYSSPEDNIPKKYRLYIGNTKYLSGLDGLRRTYEHELGHCINTDHSPDPTDNMHQPPLVDISQNESDIVKIIYTLPNFTDMKYYNNIKQRNAVKGWNLYQ